MLHIYHAAVGDKEFQFPKKLNTTSESAFQASMQEVYDEVSDQMLENLSEEDAKCVSCEKKPTRFVHHPMLFMEQDPPRVEDTPQPVCDAPECRAYAAALFKVEMAEAYAGLAVPPQFMSKCFCCEKSAPPTKPLLRCSGCKLARYCSAECQKKDWKAHKRVCEAHRAASVA